MFICADGSKIHISIHALLAESDMVSYQLSRKSRIFLSTLSLRRATSARFGVVAQINYFYPRSPCGERRVWVTANARYRLISIHALLAESDGTCHPNKTQRYRFLSTLSLRRATILLSCSANISLYFYPRSPCGERRPLPCLQVFMHYISIHALLAESDVGVGVAAAERFTFLSTLSLRRATINTVFKFIIC